MNKELKRLSRKDLLEILVNQSKKIDSLTSELEEANKKLENRSINISESGSIAEASLRLNDVFKNADEAAKQYIDNIVELKEKLEKELVEVSELKKKLSEDKKKKSTAKKTTKKVVKKATKKTTTKKTTKKNK